MIDWKTTEKPPINKRIAIKLPDGRICSGTIRKTDSDFYSIFSGFEIEVINNIDLVEPIIKGNFEWFNLEKND